MKEAEPNRLPEQVRKRDGRLESFSADKVSAALFAASEALGTPNAFLARELTESVLYFLAQDDAAPIATSQQIAELVTKVIRELGQPQLAQAFADENVRRSAREAARRKDDERLLCLQLPIAGGPDLFTHACLEEYSLAAIYGRDLTAAHCDGLLRICDLAYPTRLRGRLAKLDVADDIQSVEELIGRCWRALSRAAREAGGFVAFDGLDHLLNRLQATSAQASLLLQQIAEAAAACQRTAVINLNTPRSQPPSTGSPLFADSDGPVDSSPAKGLDMLSLLDPDVSGEIEIAWHLSDCDFEPNSKLHDAVNRLVALPNIAVIFDRPRQPIVLGEGIDRNRPATLLAVEVNLPALRERFGNERNFDALLGKVGILAQMAVSAAVQKRRYLREHNDVLQREFLLDRASLAVRVLGLTEIGGDPFTGRRLLEALNEHFRRKGVSMNIETSLEGVFDQETAFRAQIKACGNLLTSVRTQPFTPLPPGERGEGRGERSEGGPDFLTLLRDIWQRTGIRRLRFSLEPR